MPHVAWSVCLCVWHTGELCKNGWADRDAVLGMGWFVWVQGTMCSTRVKIGRIHLQPRWWKLGDAAFSLITLDTWYNHYSNILRALLLELPASAASKNVNGYKSKEYRVSKTASIGILRLYAGAVCSYMNQKKPALTRVSRPMPVNSWPFDPCPK